MRRIGMRLWLSGAFAAVSLITATAVYLFGDNHRALVARSSSACSPAF